MTRVARYRVIVAEDAQRDIEDVYRTIAATEPAERADSVLRELHHICRRLSQLPGRGNVPKELRAFGVTEFREAHHGPYRVIYRILGRRVAVYCVLDGRRDVQSLLQRRLLR